MQSNNQAIEQRLLLAGFMDFNAVVNYVHNECNIQEFHGYEALRPEWITKSQTVKTLSQTDPYQTPNDMVKDISEPELQATLTGLKEKIKQHPQFDILPFDIKMVNLDYLLTCQLEINLGRAAKIAASSGITGGLGTKELLGICVDTTDHSPNVTTQIRGSTVFFSTDDPDVRFRGVDAKNGYLPGRGGESNSAIKAQTFAMYFTLGDPFMMVYRMRVSGQGGGPAPVSIQLPPGQGIVQLQLSPAIQAQQPPQQQSGQQQREVLAPANGYHRIYLLKKAGYKHIPVVLIDLQQDQIPTFFPNNLLGNLQAFMNSPRPPLVKDYFNSSLTMTFRGPRWRTYWKASWSVEGPFHA